MDLVNHIKNGDQFVFEQAFLNWQPKVYTYFIQRLKDNCFAEELTQLTFIKLWDFRHTLSTDYSFDTQLFRIARTTMIDGLRERERRKSLLQKFEAEPQQAHTSYDYNSSANDISGAINTLPPVRKKVFLLNRYHGYSYKEIAGELSISGRTVEKHISLALKQLKKILALL